MIKLFILYAIKFFLSFLRIFPLRKNQFFFMSYGGTQYSCNPRSIYEYLDSHFSGMTFVWGIFDSKKIKKISSSNKMECICPNTLRYFKKLITSEYVITNIQLPTYIPKKKKSIWINTWHGGGAFKKVEYPSVNLYSKITKRIQIKHTDFYISSSKKFTEVTSASTEIPKNKFLEIGMPRNDVFFASEQIKNNIRKEVFDFFGISYSSFAVLFAPTYRGKTVKNSRKFDFQLDIEKVKSVFEKRFGKKVALIVRAHHATKETVQGMTGIIDGTSYSDMQDLLVAADALITDYSSCIFDFSLSKKPGFLFVPDLETYENERGFYTQINEWPFPYAKSNEKLCKLIENYDGSLAEKKRVEYLEKIGSVEKGTSTENLFRSLNR